MVWSAALSVWSACGMTIPELQELINVATPGSAVELTGDVEVTGSLDVNGRKITIRSREGESYVFRRSAHTPLFEAITDADTDVRLEDVGYDGLKASGQFGASHLVDVANGTLTFGSGTRFYDLHAKNAGPISVRASGRIVMEAGASVRGFVNGEYGTVFSVGTGSNGGILEMNGGEIADCQSTAVKTGSDALVFGAAIYVYGGFFVMTGGRITGNAATHTVGGLLLYSGNVDISGTAVITGNTGFAACDVYRNGGSFYVSSKYSGRMTVFEKNAPVDGATSGIYSHQSRDDSGRADFKLVTGLGNVAYQDSQEWVLDGYTTSDGYTRWRKRLAETDGLGIVSSFSELKAVMKSGDTVTFHRDLELDSGVSWTFDGMAATLQGADGASARIVRTEANKNNPLICIKNGASVRFNDITIDGCDVVVSQPLISVDSGAQVVLGSGTTVCNVQTTAQGGMSVSGSGTVVSMEDGASFVNCCGASKNAWGTAVLVGSGGRPEVLPRFEMQGGEITDCKMDDASSASSGYGGAVYVYGGMFVMSGGRIHGNFATDTCPSVLCYLGKVELTGSARIDDNSGPYPDLYTTFGNDTDVRFVGDLRGHVGISNGSLALGNTTYVKAAEGATGAWSLFPSSQNADVDLCGRLKDDGVTVTWVKSVGKVDYMSVSSVEDANAACPKTVAVDVTDLTALPHTFSGKATEIAGVSVSLLFDPIAVKRFLRESHYRTTIPVFASDTPFTGDVSFVLPENCPEGFLVGKSNDGCHYYVWYSKGLSVILR